MTTAFLPIRLFTFVLGIPRFIYLTASGLVKNNNTRDTARNNSHCVTAPAPAPEAIAAARYMKRGIPRTNVNSLIGKKAVVIQKIDNLSQTGQVRINDIEWMARTESDGEKIPEESVVEIEAVRGVKLIVKKCKEEL